MAKIEQFIGHIVTFDNGNKFLRVDQFNWYRYIGPSLAKQGRDTPGLEFSFKAQQDEDFKLDKDA